MSKAQKIHDHAAWMGSSSKDNPLPMHSKERSFSDHEEDGHLSSYEDKEEDIKRQQEADKRQQKKNNFKPGQRN